MTDSAPPSAPADETPPSASLPPPAPPPRPRRRWPWAVAGLVVVVAGIVAACLLIWPEISRLIERPAPVAKVDEMAELRRDLAATRAELAQVQARPAPSGTEDGRLAAVEEAVKALQAQPQGTADDVAALNEKVAALARSAVDAASVLRLADRLDKVEAGLREVQARRSATATLLLAAGQLRSAVDLGMPFDGELRAVQALAGGDADVARDAAVLAPHAAAGIPTRPVLASRFAALEPAVVRAEALPADGGWWRQSVDRLFSLVTIRREDGAVAGDGAAAVVARTAARLADNDLAGAVAEGERLPTAAAAVAAPWLGDARARRDADHALSDLTAHLVAVAGAGPQP